MKPGQIGLAALLLIGLVAVLARGNTMHSIYAFILEGDHYDERRAQVIEFAATHDWEAELSLAGIALTADAQSQLLGPLLEREHEDETSAITYRTEVRFSGWNALFPPIAEISRATTLISARLEVESLLIDAGSHTDPRKRRGRCWKAYGSGFDERVATFLDERRETDPDPEVRAFYDTLHRRAIVGQGVEGSGSESAPR